MECGNGSSSKSSDDNVFRGKQSFTCQIGDPFDRRTTYCCQGRGEITSHYALLYVSESLKRWFIVYYVSVSKNVFPYWTSVS